jgi:nucleotide-binding universal stress UspA family protein
LAQQALPYAEALAQKFNGELILLWVVQPSAMATEYAIPAYDLTLKTAREAAQTYLSHLQETYRQRHISARSLVLTKTSVAEAILDAALDAKADVIVKTTHGRSGFSRFVYGSVATKVLQQAPCPVLLVRVKPGDR